MTDGGEHHGEHREHPADRGAHDRGDRDPAQGPHGQQHRRPPPDGASCDTRTGGSHRVPSAATSVAPANVSRLAAGEVSVASPATAAGPATPDTPYVSVSIPRARSGQPPRPAGQRTEPAGEQRSAGARDHQRATADHGQAEPERTGRRRERRGVADATRGEGAPGIASPVDEPSDPRPEQVRGGERGSEEAAEPDAACSPRGQQNHAHRRARVGRARHGRRERVPPPRRHLFNR